MDANQVNDVIDKLADKMGMAADKVQPLAERVVSEFQSQATVTAICCGILVVIGIVLLPFLLRMGIRATKEERIIKNPGGYYEGRGYPGRASARMAVGFASSIITTILTFVCAVETIIHVRHAVAPTYYLLQGLLG
ncbi:hypothetical protein LCGC14_0235240 [marine sediment metagenome]|uniref:Uncharacterized protein n=1 Tax=marine sediment metagenome TaxID=412755 RepID=A0A0F9XD34_9ZZZZ